MMKKVLVMALAFTSLTASVFAAIPRDQMHIGGLKTGMTMEQVAAVYGMPKKVQSDSKAARGMYEIAGGLISGWIDSDTNTFNEYCINEGKMGAERITASWDIRLGMTIAEVERRLGKPDFVDGRQVVSYYYQSVEHGASWREHDVLNLSFKNGRLSSFTINVF